MSNPAKDPKPEGTTSDTEDSTEDPEVQRRIDEVLEEQENHDHPEDD